MCWESASQPPLGRFWGAGIGEEIKVGKGYRLTSGVDDFFACFRSSRINEGN
jgi:hypothetical protein